MSRGNSRWKMGKDGTNPDGEVVNPRIAHRKEEDLRKRLISTQRELERVRKEKARWQGQFDSLASQIQNAFIEYKDIHLDETPVDTFNRPSNNTLMYQIHTMFLAYQNRVDRLLQTIAILRGEKVERRNIRRKA